MFKKILLGLALAVLLISVIFYGCGKVVQEGGGGGGGTSGLFQYSPATPSITGVVRETGTGNAISGVTVSVVGIVSTTGVRASATISTTTNATGNFILKGVMTGDNVIIKYEKSGYNYFQINLPVSQYLVVDGSASLKTYAVSQSIANLAIINTVADPISGASVTIPANQCGSTVNLTPFDGGSRLFPGSYADNTGQSIKSYGFINVEGITNLSNVQMVIPSTSSAPLTCPVYYFDDQASVWKQAPGTATKLGNNYQYTIPATFTAGIGSKAVANPPTYWNIDNPYTTSYLTGFVTDQSGNPIAGAMVFCYGQGYVTLRPTNTQGYFIKIPVEASSLVKVVVVVPNTAGAEQDNITTAPPTQEKVIPDTFIVNYPDVSKVNQMDVTPILKPNIVSGNFSVAVAPAASGRAMDVALNGDNNNINYFTYDGSNWGTGPTVSSYLGVNTIIRITSDGKPKICFWSTLDNSLYYAYQSGGNWVTKQIVQATSGTDNIYYSLALDSNNKAYVIYSIESTGQTQFDINEISSANDVDWSAPTKVTTITQKIVRYNSISLAIGPSNQRAFIYKTYDTSGIDYCYFVQYDTASSSWGNPILVTTSPNQLEDFEAKLQFSKGGSPLIAVMVGAGNATGGFNSSIQLFQQGAHTWNVSDVVRSQNSAYLSAFDFAIDNNGNPLITYNDTIYPQGSSGSIINILKYATFVGTQISQVKAQATSDWKIFSVDVWGAVYSNILVGKDNTVRIFYQTNPFTGSVRTKLAEYIP